MSTVKLSEPGPSEEMLRMMVMHKALTGSDARRYGSPVARVEWEFGSVRRDVGAFAEDRCGAQHHGNDHQLDVPDTSITSGAQHHQTDRGAGRLSRPEYRSKSRVISPKIQTKSSNIKPLICFSTLKALFVYKCAFFCILFHSFFKNVQSGTCVHASLRFLGLKKVAFSDLLIVMSWNFERSAH